MKSTGVNPCNKAFNVKAIFHYSTLDLECDSDYYDLELFIDDVLVKTYDDDYHDKGWEKMEGFIDCLVYLYGDDNIHFTKEDIADRSDY